MKKGYLDKQEKEKTESYVPGGFQIMYRINRIKQFQYFSYVQVGKQVSRYVGRQVGRQVGIFCHKKYYKQVSRQVYFALKNIYKSGKKELKIYKYTKNAKKIDKYKTYDWDDTKRAEVALFSLWSFLKRKILETEQRVESNKYQK